MENDTLQFNNVLPRTEAQKEWDVLTDRYVRKNYPDAESWRNLHSVSAPRSTCWTSLELKLGDRAVRVDVSNSLIG